MVVSLDFLSQITKVNFAGQWFGVWCGTFTDLPVDISVTFPDVEGGTPGFTLCSASNPPGVNPKGFIFRAPRKILAADLAGTLDSRAGQAFNAFWLTQQNIPVLGPTGRGSQIFFNLSSFPKTPFHVKVAGNTDASDAQASVEIYTKNSIKAGITLDAAGVFTVSNPVEQSINFAVNVAGHTVIVDPTKLTLSEG
jgi:hypothetical protein